MGQKTNPIINRLGIIIGWQSSWCNNYKDRIQEDSKVRKYIEARFPKGIISRVIIERTLKFITITIRTSRPALVIGKGGDEVDTVRKELKRLTKKEVQINISEVKRPELDAPLVAKGLVRQLENRISYKKAIRLAILSAIRMNAKGIKIQISGRLNGAEMARRESYKEGRISLGTFRADVDYYMDVAHTVYGSIGIKVWIMKGEIYGKRELYPLFSIQQRKLRFKKYSSFRKKKS
ncbi:MAG: 30S ribosomal protein S3 [Flavobacteriales bacterium]|jgi:small subunit ribosomal protein S3|uniref:30S ribosomal protein S3 n=1 Tax=Blattabacterium sp. (Mastotermes darwiniensis) TaxID=39768 RepID=UPI000231DE6D|nr:30S ribosomal protein S3 [Blattabacterium sp. (Mastotermes darwiniensis)]AER40673.1 30S ribosomal protein S3 [Blattabacterium sp. (Mastotermes darwiniensis) str. MADAR]MDR1804799.1 30S ribosomal protein S3 [Flavobacteriales bacterium]